MTSRAERIRPFRRVRVSSREAYLKQAECERSQTLCHVMHQRAGQVAKGLSVDVGAEWFGFPWLTMIIGTGCLEAADGALERAAAFAEGVTRAITSSDRIAAPYIEATYSFTKTLATDRLLAGRRGKAMPVEDDSRTTRHGDAPVAKVSDAAARVVYAAALATRAYYAIGRQMTQAMSRRSSDQLLIGRGDEDESLVMLIDATRAALNYAMSGLDRSATTEKVDEAVCKLLDELKDELDYDRDDVRCASAYRIRLLTEVAWYYLVESTDIYPGWTDLLLRLMLMNADVSVSSGAPRQPRPRYDSIDELVDVAKTIMEEPSLRSWNGDSGESPTPSGRKRVYEQAAKVLRAQAAAHEQQDQLPPAVVFVSTLDLEMEFALAKAEPSLPFSIAVPIYLRPTKDTDYAHFCWVIADVEPPRGRGYDIRDITEAGNWRLLSASRLPPTLKGRPIVMHLCGAPLIKAPKLTQELIDDLEKHGIDATASWCVTPAITVDEYLAMRQSEVELSWLSRDRQEAGSTKPLHPPKELTTSSDNGIGCRYWLTMGVPFSDPAVRTRVLAQIGAAQRLRAPAAETAPRDQSMESAPSRTRFRPPASTPEPTKGEASGGAVTPRPASDGDAAPALAEIVGAAVNLYIDDDEIALLHWLGLDVVEDTCDAFATDLGHYVDHLDAKGADKRPPLRQRCTLGRPA